MHSPINVLGERLWKQENISHNPHCEQNIVPIYGATSFVTPLLAERINACGSIGCPNKCLGHKSVHIWHWQHAAIARFISICILLVFFCTINAFGGITKTALLVFVTVSYPFTILPVIGPPPINTGSSTVAPPAN